MKTIKVFSLIFLLVFFAFAAASSLALAKNWPLMYTLGMPTKDYNKIIEQVIEGKEIKEGDTLSWGNKKYTIKKVEGHGGTAVIVNIAEDESKVLRIPKKSNYEIPNDFDFINFYYQSYVGLSDLDIPIVKVYLREGNKDAFLVMQKVKIDFTLEDFLKTLKGRSSKIPLLQGQEKIEKIKEALLDFIKSSHQVVELDDVHADNVGWVNGKWVLIDYAAGLKTFSYYGNDISDHPNLEKHLLKNPFIKFPKQLDQQLTEAVKNFRLEKFQKIKLEREKRRRELEEERRRRAAQCKVELEQRDQDLKKSFGLFRKFISFIKGKKRPK